jgi:hypothetical protein
MVMARLLDLISLPIPGAPDFQVPYPHNWPDFLYLLPDRVLGAIRNNAPAGWQNQIARLLETLKEAPHGARGRIALRLQKLREYDCLSEREISRFARLLWKTTEPATGLPDVDPFYRSVVLGMPEPRQGIALERFRAYLKNSDLLRVGTRNVAPDGRVTWSITQYVDQDGFLNSWVQSIAKTRAQMRQNPGRFVRATSADVTGLFKKIKRWWDEEGRPIQSQSQRSPPFGEGVGLEPLSSRIMLILEVLRDVVLAALRPTHTMAQQVLGCIEEIRNLGYPTEAIEPALLKFHPESAQTALVLRRGLTSFDTRRYLHGARGVIFWLRTQERRGIRPIGYDIPPPPPMLLMQLCDNFASRRQPGLQISVDAMGTILSECPRAVDTSVGDAIQVGLGFLLAEANYQPRSPMEGSLLEPNIPRLRKKIARLIRFLGKFPVGQSEVVARWKDVLSNDPLPEVRAEIEGEE